MKFVKLISVSMVFASSLVASVASASVFRADYNKSVWTGYNDETSVYSMKFEDTGTADGFWLVVSDGPNPKKHDTEYAILYGDRAANRITAYAYDGENSANSYQTSKFLGSYDNVFTSAGTHPKLNIPLTMFTLDVAALNTAIDAPEWDGVQIGAQAGIWFHQSEGSNFAYADDGTLLNYTFSDQMWVDSGYKNTRVRQSPNCGPNSGNGLCNGTTLSSPPGSVSAPSGLALLFAGLIGLRMRKRR